MPGSGDRPNRSGATPSVIGKLLHLLAEQTHLEPLPFNRGCSESDIKQTEQLLNAKLPEDFKEFLRYCNGQSDSRLLTFPPDQIAFLSIAGIGDLWKELNKYRDDQFFEKCQSNDQIRCVLYHPGRIPIAYNEVGGAYLFLDYIPGPNGKEGQIIFNINEADCVVIEDSFHNLLQGYLHFLETAKAVVRKQPPEYGEGYRFVSSKNEYIDWKVYQKLKRL